MPKNNNKKDNTAQTGPIVIPLSGSGSSTKPASNPRKNFPQKVSQKPKPTIPPPIQSNPPADSTNTQARTNVSATAPSDPSSSSDSTPPTSSTTRPQAQRPPQQYSDSWGFDDNFDDTGSIGSDFGDLDGLAGGSPYGGFGGTGYSRSPRQMGSSAGYSPQKRLTPEERVKMIETVYEEILGRKPDTRDINYYKYSTLGKDQIRKQLLSSAEHKEIMKKGREYEQLRDRSEQLETRVRMLEGQIKDQVEEFRELSQLLQEKNQHINELRSGTVRATPKPADDYDIALAKGTLDEYAAVTSHTGKKSKPIHSQTPQPSAPIPTLQSEPPSTSPEPPVQEQAQDQPAQPEPKQPTQTIENTAQTTASPPPPIFTDSTNAVPEAPDNLGNPSDSNISGKRSKEVLNSILRRVF